MNLGPHLSCGRSHPDAPGVARYVHGPDPAGAYIGSRTNRLSASVGVSAQVLALIPVVRRHGGSVQDAGDVFSRYLQACQERA